MKQLICEMCGGKELIKQDGVFVCQNCQARYSVEEAKKMMVEIDTSAKLENALKNARRARENRDYEQAEKCYNIIQTEEPENWEANFYSIYSKAIQNVKFLYGVTGPIEDCIKTVLKNIKIMDDIAQQNKAIEQIKTDLFVLISEKYKFIIDDYNSQKAAKIAYTNIARDKFLPFSDILNFFGNELISEFGKNEFTNLINIQCHETALNILRKLHDETFIPSTSLVKIDESKFIFVLKQYAEELEKVKHSGEKPKQATTQEVEPNVFADLESEKKDGSSFLTKPLAPNGCGCGCLPAFATTPIAIIGVIAFGIIMAIITPESSSTSASNIGGQKIEARVELELSIKANLREPKSYQNIATDVWTVEEYIFVKNTFRGKNRFGGYEVCTFVAQFNFNTKPIGWKITNNPNSDSGCRAIMIALP